MNKMSIKQKLLSSNLPKQKSFQIYQMPKCQGSTGSKKQRLGCQNVVTASEITLWEKEAKTAKKIFLNQIYSKNS